MDDITWLKHLNQAETNEDRFEIAREPLLRHRKEFILGLILLHARSNSDRWMVFWGTDDEDVQEFSLMQIVVHAATIPELLEAYEYSIGEMRKLILTKIELLSAKVLRSSKSENKECFVVFHATTNPTIQKCALKKILHNNPSYSDIFNTYCLASEFLEIKMSAYMKMACRPHVLQLPKP